MARIGMVNQACLMETQVVSSSLNSSTPYKFTTIELEHLKPNTRLGCHDPQGL
jgi:hypothetical protein